MNEISVISTHEDKSSAITFQHPYQMYYFTNYLLLMKCFASLHCPMAFVQDYLTNQQCYVVQFKSASVLQIILSNILLLHPNFVSLKNI